MHLSLVGDVCLEKKAIAFDFKEVLHPHQGFAIGNLETPLAPEGASPRPKAGPNIKGQLERLKNLHQHYPNWVFTLANNHAMDYGTEGIVYTQQHCQNLSFRCLGAGNTLSDAKSPLFLEQNGIRVGILARCETQFGAASASSAGVATLDSHFYQEVQKLKGECDILVLSIHGGSEICAWPSPQWQNRFRSLIDAGADVVHGHHAHVPQGYESYNHGFIYYGLGNFIANPKLWSRHANGTWSIVPTLSIENNQLTHSVKTVVLEGQEDKVCVRVSTPEEAQKHQRYLDQCNAPLENLEFLESVWQEASVQMYKSFYGDYLEFSKSERQTKFRLVPFARKHLGRLKRQLTNSPSQRQLLLWYHLFACETHRDVIATALGVLSGELEDKRSEQSQAMVKEMMPRLVV